MHAVCHGGVLEVIAASWLGTGEWLRAHQLGTGRCVCCDVLKALVSLCAGGGVQWWQSSGESAWWQWSGKDGCCGKGPHVRKTHAWISRACCLVAVALHADEPTTSRRSKMMIVGEAMLLVAVVRVGVLRLRPWNQACPSRREVFGR